MPEEKFPRWRVQLVREDHQEYEQFCSPEAVARRFAFLREETVETFYVVFLNTNNCIVGMQEISRGTIDRSFIEPREVFQAAILANCTSILLVHAHPSGNTTPSNADRDATDRLRRAGRLLGIRILDHLIIGIPGYYSFAEESNWEKLSWEDEDE